MACSLCGSTTDLVFNEAWAGSFHSACHHCACLSCVRRHIEGQLPKAAAEGQLRVRCFVSSCPRVLPQMLVLKASRKALRVAELLDACEPPLALPIWKACPSCGQPGEELTNSCGHWACEACWQRQAEAHVPYVLGVEHGCVPCLHPGCSQPVAQELWRCLEAHEAVAAVAGQAALVEAKLRELGQFGEATREGAGHLGDGPVCHICQEPRVALLRPQTKGAEHGLAACEQCWVRWAEEGLERCFWRRTMAVPCIFAPTELLDQGLWELACARSQPVAAVQALLARRAALQRNQLYPAPMQVNCPQPRCLGLGYLGFDTVMCFICEHQWVPEELGEPPPEVAPEEVMGLAVKRCPTCREYIEKNGGCDHMTCRCRHEFYWTTLKPYRTQAQQ